MAGVKLKWFGPQVVAKVERASIKGVNATMSEAIILAKRNHPGWQNRTGKAEGSITIIDKAKSIGQHVEGRWGSKGTNYMIWLELKYGGALRAAAAIIYPRLGDNIRKFFK